REGLSVGNVRPGTVPDPPADSLGVRGLLRRASGVSERRSGAGEAEIRPPSALERPEPGRAHDCGHSGRDHLGQGQARSRGDPGEPASPERIPPLPLSEMIRFFGQGWIPTGWYRNAVLLSRRDAMLVLSRSVGEEIVIDGNVRLTIVAVKGDRVRVGI